MTDTSIARTIDKERDIAADFGECLDDSIPARPPESIRLAKRRSSRQLRSHGIAFGRRPTLTNRHLPLPAVPILVTPPAYHRLTMTTDQTFIATERVKASNWKLATTVLPAEAKVAAPYFDKDGSSRGPKYDFCLPAEHSALSLLPEVRDSSLALFTELGIPWHAGVRGGPGNHLLSSQVQCVNALGQMVADPDRIIRAFGPLLGTAEVHQIEPDRWLTFEYIGTDDHLNEAVNGTRTRGARCTSVDAAFVHSTRAGIRELVLVEWKYTEHYARRTAAPAKDAIRYERYGQLLAASDGPIAIELLPFEELLQEPLYQLMRQQLLAHQLEKVRAHGANRVRVVHVLPAGNLSYHSSLHGAATPQLGSTVKAVWQRLLRHPDRFIAMDSAVFLDPQITSPHYIDRYGDGLTRPSQPVA